MLRLKLIRVGEILPVLHTHVGDFSQTQLLSGSFSRAHLLNVVMSMGFTGLGVHSSWFWLKERLVFWFCSPRCPGFHLHHSFKWLNAMLVGSVECTCFVVVQDFISDRREVWKDIVSLSQQLLILPFWRVLHQYYTLFSFSDYFSLSSVRL